MDSRVKFFSSDKKNCGKRKHQYEVAKKRKAKLTKRLQRIIKGKEPVGAWTQALNEELKERRLNGVNKRASNRRVKRKNRKGRGYRFR